MTLRWVDDNELVNAIPGNRRKFYREIEQSIRNLDPEALERMNLEIAGWLDDVVDGRADYASVKRNAGADWTGHERQAIFNATQDWNQSRWWCGLLLMKVAIEHPRRFICYKPDDPDSEIAIAYFLDPRQM